MTVSPTAYHLENLPAGVRVVGHVTHRVGEPPEPVVEDAWGQYLLSHWYRLYGGGTASPGVARFPSGETRSTSSPNPPRVDRQQQTLF